MKYRILTIDCHAQHRQVLRHLVQKIFPDVHLEEYDPGIDGEPEHINWADYQLLILDNRQGEADGIDWFERYRQEKGFPATIFMSSYKNPNEMDEAMSRDIVRAMKLGAKDFLFKRTIRSKQLVRHISTVLEQYGYQPPLQKTAAAFVQDVLQRIPDETSEIGDKEAVEDLSPTDQLVLATQDTQHEINLAMAMLHGAEEWPFDFKDILAGRAVIGRYKITAYLEKGEHTTTFKAVHQPNNQAVLLKMLTFQSVGDGDIAEKCQSMLQDVLTWDHPNLIQWQDFQLYDARLVVAQEILQGESLAARLAKCGVTEDMAIDYTAQLMSALEKIHAAGFYIGNLSPENIMFRDTGTPVVTDIGVFRRLHAMNNIAADPVSKNPAYASPEHIQGRRIDSRSDLYALGIILYEMLAGHPPYYKGSAKDILYAHVTADIPRLPDAKHPLNLLIQELLMKTPSRRIQTAGVALSQMQGMLRNYR